MQLGKKSELMDILAKEKSFFIDDICIRYGYKNKTVWNFIKYHQDLFYNRKVQTNKVGRPKKKYYYQGDKKDGIQSKQKGSASKT